MKSARILNAHVHLFLLCCTCLRSFCCFYFFPPFIFSSCYTLHVEKSIFMYIFFHIILTFRIVICLNDSCVFVPLSILSLFVDVPNQMGNVSIPLFFHCYFFTFFSAYHFFPLCMAIKGENRMVKKQWKVDR